MARKATTLQGFLIHDERCKLDNVAAVGAGATDSSYTEANPRPGQAVADAACSRIRPQVHGVQTEDLKFGCVRGGNPGPDGTGIVWRKASETASEFRSWNPPVVLQHFQWVELEATSAVDWADKALVVVPDTQVVVLVAHDIDVTSPENNKVSVYTPETRTWTAQATVDAPWKGGALSAVYHPDICGILVFSTPSGESGTAYISTDEGATWEQYAAGLTDTNPANSGRNARAEVDRHGNILLLVENSDVETWVSSDAGHAFVKQEDWAADWTSFDTCALPTGEIVIVYYETTATTLYCVVLANAFESIQTATSSAVTVTTNNGQIVACYADAGGVLYVYARPTLDEQVTLFRSLDSGQTFVNFSKDAHLSDTTTGYHSLRAVPCCGEALLVGNPTNPTSNGYEGSLISMQFGGWSNVEHDPVPGADTRTITRYGWGLVWLSTELPANNGWSETGAGTIALSADGWNISTSSNFLYESQTITYVADTASILFEVEQVSGGSLATTDIGMRITRDDGSNKTILYVNIDSTGFRLIENVVTTLVTVSVDMTTARQVLIYYDALDNITVWHRSPGDATWTGGTSYSLTTSATVASGNTITFGNVVSATAESNWQWLAWADDSILRHTIAGTASYDGFRWGRGLDSRPYPVRDEGDSDARTRLSLAGAPGRRGDLFDIDARHEHGIANLFPQISPSPKRAWRSTQVATAEDWVFDFGEDTRFQPGDFLALMVTGKHTPRTIVVSTRADAAGSWTIRGTYDGATDFSGLTYTLSGDILYANGGTEGGRHIYDAEHNGGYVVLDTGGTPKARTILETHAGRWNGSTAEAWFRLGGIDGTEVATATCNIVSPGGVLLIPFTAAAEFRRVRIRVSAQDLPDSYFTVGAHCFGGVMVPGHRMSRGWSMRYTPNTSFREDSYGTTFADKRGPVRREFTWSYQDALDELEMLGTSSATHVSTGAGGVELAARGDVLGRLAGMLIQSRGGSLPIVGILDVPEGTSVTTITDPNLWIYGLLTGNVLQANHVHGRVGENAIRRIESLTIREQPWDLD